MTQPQVTPKTPVQILIPAEARARATSNDVTKALTDAGFVLDNQLRDQYVAKAVKDDLSHNGQYVIQSVWTKGFVTLLFEQNTAVEDIGGLSAAISHPAVCVASSPQGRVACNANDAELILSVAEELG